MYKQDMAKHFTDKVKEIVRAIPKGSVLTYKEVAKRAGNENASRAVGNIMKNNFDDSVPCHRVIRSDGNIGDYNRGGRSIKQQMLLEEGYVL